MLAVARLFAQSRPATGLDWEWVVEISGYVLLLFAGLGLIFLTIKVQGRLQRGGASQLITFKDLFTFKTNTVGLFALIGVLLIGATLFLRTKDYRRQINAVETTQGELESELKVERALREEQQSVRLEYLLEFPEEGARPGDLADVKVYAMVYSSEKSEPQRVDVLEKPETGAIRATVEELNAGDSVSLHATDGEQSWKSDYSVVPSVPVPMHKREAEQHTGHLP
ncbi:hypothetical protein [Vitiosangium sp. GDMCC 1.1324]|uniref:hypothetical protein n=1 Tax=Vitiosangium sp. (strain GDMCC 1.1324) TaxID=2138576 RepID=UPI000D3786FF|nr:hypothetical protein [Vitiosangium sp. GDMCC 1.1324]PTL75107.1 hypothetical protein DAT35_56695 [Vitiosangium sp. GDMCC 1.1324]